MDENLRIDCSSDSAAATIPTDPDYELADRIIAFLNSLLTFDRRAITNLIEIRTNCNEVLADHPTVQVCACGHAPIVGLLGILNGLCGIQPDGWGLLAVRVDDDNNVIEFIRTSELNNVPVSGS